MFVVLHQLTNRFVATEIVYLVYSDDLNYVEGRLKANSSLYDLNSMNYVV